MLHSNASHYIIYVRLLQGRAAAGKSYMVKSVSWFDSGIPSKQPSARSFSTTPLFAFVRVRKSSTDVNGAPSREAPMPSAALMPTPAIYESGGRSAPSSMRNFVAWDL